MGLFIYWYLREALMSKNTSVALGEHFSSFVERQVADGRYGTASEVVRAGLRLLEEKEARHQALRAAIREGLDSGPSQAVDWGAYVRRRRGKMSGP
jgi:antitoxin ParD1/3/4